MTIALELTTYSSGLLPEDSRQETRICRISLERVQSNECSSPHQAISSLRRTTRNWSSELRHTTLTKRHCSMRFTRTLTFTGTLQVRSSENLRKRLQTKNVTSRSSQDSVFSTEEEPTRLRLAR